VIDSSRKILLTKKQHQEIRMKINLIERLQKYLSKQQHQSLQTIPPLPFTYSTEASRDRQPYDQQTILHQALEAWRLNPLARRIVGLTSQYVVGGGIRLQCSHAATEQFLSRWWQHDLNQCALRVYEWCDELTRAGELFFLLSTDTAGMTYVRAVPASQITAIDTADNDLQQEQGYHQQLGVLEEEKIWQAYDSQSDAPDQSVMLHFAINRPPGVVRGESDLAPLLVWLNRYAIWLEDRARLNRYRNAFYFVVKARFLGEAERAARQAVLNAAPPTPGSILVTDESEQWEVIHPRLESHEASADGLSIKKMIAAGAGLPLHFLAEPESSTRSTAEAAGGPTFRHFEQRQLFFTEMLRQMAVIAVRRRAMIDPAIDPEAVIQVQAADLSARDNAALAIATQAASNTFFDLFDRGLIDRDELMRMVYRFAGEVQVQEPHTVDVDDPARQIPAKSGGKPVGKKVIDPESGESRGIASL
jgi:hypothetical protein